MKRKLLIVCAAGLLLASCGNDKPKASTELVNNPATASGKSSDVKVPVMTFEKTDHNFGFLTEGEVAEYSFIFTNEGSQDLLISNASASCGCTVPEFPKEPVKAGEKGKIRVRFNSEKRVGTFEKAIVVTANTVPADQTLYIRGEVKSKTTN